MYKSLTILSIIAFMSYTLPINAQTSIKLNNPSFEDAPASSNTPIGWQDCGKPGETPPDTQPDGTFHVTKPAKEGSTYIGMVTRDTDTWEAVGQMLETPLQGGKCYDFSLYLARSESYLSSRKSDATKIQFTQPIKLRIWGGSNYCDKAKMLDETEAIEHTNWKAYEFTLSPVGDIHYIVLEAYYVTPTLMAYNGNLLIDDCSAITLTKCPGEKPLIAENDKPAKRSRDKDKSKTKKDTKKDSKKDTKKPKTSSNKRKDKGKIASVDKKEPVSKTPESKVEKIEKEDISSKTPPPSGGGFNRKKPETDDKTVQGTSKSPPVEKKDPVVEAKPKPKPTKPKPKAKPKVLTGISEIDETAIEEGQVIRVDKLRFPANSSTLTESSHEILDEVYDFLMRNRHIIIEIGGHTNGVPSHEYCNRLSKERAESVARYLIERGINKERIAAEGYGKTQPIADNDTSSGRKKNQRVEIKIISVKG